MPNGDAIRILYDGGCPICCRKVRFLQKRDRSGKLCFSDIRAAGFQPLETGVPMAELEKQIHAVLPGGTVISRMAVIRAAYREVGLGWLAAPTGWPLLRPLFDGLYALVAKYRTTISRLFQ
jgi:predicted DCC family thiol-disulfide oxidoreductase YuxK